MKFKCEKIGNLQFGNELKSILEAQGVTDVEGFLSPSEYYWENPYKFLEMQNAVMVFKHHLNNKSKVLIVVDCDLDGYTSAAKMYKYIKDLDDSIVVDFVLHEGKIHGLEDVFEQVKSSEAELIIIPDAGTGDAVMCNELMEMKKDVIILDHHNISKENSLAYVINNQLESGITDKAMTGVGIVLKFCEALDMELGVKHARKNLDLVALGMIADVADLRSLQSRYYVLKGLNEINNKFLKALVESRKFAMKNKITITNVAFYIAPMINSLIRFGTLEEKEVVFKALVELDERYDVKVRGKGVQELSVYEYALKLCESANRKQKKVTEETADILSDQIKVYGQDKNAVMIVNAKDDVESTITGLIANKLVSKFKKPCLLMRNNNGYCSGSARGYSKSGIANFNKWCVDTGLFSKVAGHDNAFGVGISVENIPKLIQIISQIDSTSIPTYFVYDSVDCEKLNADYIKLIGQNEDIYGCGVTEPLFEITNVNCNKHGVKISGSKDNRICFKIGSVSFMMLSSGSLAEEYKSIIETGDNLNFHIVGKFKNNNGEAEVLIEDFEVEKSEVETNPFGCFNPMLS